MNPIIEYQKIYNTLMLIETRGESTKILAECLTYIEQLIEANVQQTNVEPAETAEVTDEAV